MFSSLVILKTVEMIHINDNDDNSCQAIADLPEAVYGHSIVNTYNGPVLCGGITNSGKTQDCHRLSSNGSWSKFPNLNDARWYFSMTDVNDLLVSIGGAGAPPSFEVINVQNGTSWVRKELPFRLHGHCSTKINETSILITGGYSDFKASKSILS